MKKWIPSQREFIVIGWGVVIIQALEVFGVTASIRGFFSGFAKKK